MNIISQLDSIKVPSRRSSKLFQGNHKMNDNRSLAYLQNSVLYRAANIQKLTEVEQINFVDERTEFLNLVDYGNEHYLK